MNTYLVGGAVRDELLGKAVVDRDWVVVGTTPEAMLEQGYRPVGKDFPVFLHPETHEEYALARTERKTAPGYHGFSFNTDISVTLEEDLERRDLTINAMALDTKGGLIDPYNGKQDLDDRILRHVSDAFMEDPVRVLRVAKFMARLSPMGFRVADETRELMSSMVINGEVDNLVAERVWQEMQAAMLSENPRAFFETLADAGALEVILPEVDALFGVPQPEKWHPEIDSGEHTMLVLDQACLLSASLNTRMAALCHDLGKATTPSSEWPSHRGHEERGHKITQTLAKRLRLPANIRDTAMLTARHHTHCHDAEILTASKLTRLLQTLDVTRKPERFNDILMACEADAKGRLGMASIDYPQRDYLLRAADAFRAVDGAAVAAASTDKRNIADNLHAARVSAIKQWRKSL